MLGHESLGVVKEAPADGDFAAGDLVVGIVRRPDPVPCDACARGEFDMCRNGLFKERGINQLDGYGSERWRVESDYCVKLDPALRSVGMLMEPTTVVAKAVEQMRRIGEAMGFEARRVLVTGAGPIGLLGAMLGGPARPRGPRPRSRHGWAQAPARRANSARPTTPVTSSDAMGDGEGRRDPRGDRRRQTGLRRDGSSGPGRRRLPDRAFAGRGNAVGRSGLDQPRSRASEQRRARLGQRQPAPLPRPRPRRWPPPTAPGWSA